MMLLTDKQTVQATLDFLKTRFEEAGRLGTFFATKEIPLVKDFGNSDLLQHLQILERQLIDSDLFEKADGTNNLRLSKIGRLVKDEFNWNYQTYLNSLIPSNEELEAKRKDLLKSIEDSEIHLKKVIEDSEKHINKVISDAQELSQKVSVSKYGAVFENESTAQEELAKKWLVGIFICLVVIVTTAWCLKDSETKEFRINFLLSKVVILSAMFYALAVCNRNYRALKHNAILNNHRKNALLTFDTFSNSADKDTQERHSVLEAVTRTIFSNQSTGYSSSVSTETDQSNKIIEIVKHIGKHE